MLRVCLISFGVLICTQPLWAQSSHEGDWTRTYEAALKKCQSSTSCIELEALRLFPITHDEGCETTMQRSALLLFNRSPEDAERLHALTQLAECDTSFSQLRYNLGMLAWRQGQLREAERHFLMGAQLVEGDRKAVWMTAAGAVAYEDLRMETAKERFIEAYRLDSVHAAPMLLNNLSAISLTLGRPEECALWGERALSRYAEFENDIDAGVGPEFSQYVHFNLFVAYTTLQDVQEATSHWDRLDFKSLNVHPIQLAELLSMFARLTDQPALLDLYGEPLRQRIMGFQQSGRLGSIAYLEDPLVSLFTQEAAPFVDSMGLREAWSLLRPNVSLRSGWSTEASDSALSEARDTWREGAFWGFVAIGLAFFVLLLRLVRFRAQAEPQTPWARLLDRMQDTPLAAAEQSDLERVLLDIQRHQEQVSPRVEPSTALNDSERIALSDGIQGVFPKTTAQNHHWTPTYVYILRSSVRSKLGIAPNIPFNRWQERYPELAEEALRGTPSPKSDDA